MNILVPLERFSRNFVNGFAENVYLLSSFVRDNSKHHHIPPYVPINPSSHTALSRRRALKQRAPATEPLRTNERDNMEDRVILFKIVLKNSLFCGACVLLVTHLIVPAVGWIGGDLWTGHAERVVNAVLFTFWLAPIMVLSKVINIFWMADLAAVAYRARRGRSVNSDIPFLVSDFVFTAVLELAFILQIFVLSFIPLTVQRFNILEFVLTAISYSLYSFEYKWMSMGLSCRTRLELIEGNFAYHFGFGSPLALLVLHFDNYLFRFVLYSVFFPFLILAAVEAKEPFQRLERRLCLFMLPAKLTNQLFCILRRQVSLLGPSKTALFWASIFIMLTVLYCFRFTLMTS